MKTSKPVASGQGDPGRGGKARKEEWTVQRRNRSHPYNSKEAKFARRFGLERVERIKKMGFSDNALEVAKKISYLSPKNILALEEATGFVPEPKKWRMYSFGHLFPEEKRISPEEFAYSYPFHKEAVGGRKSFVVHIAVKKNGRIVATAVDTSGSRLETNSPEKIKDPEIRKAIKAFREILGIA